MTYLIDNFLKDRAVTAIYGKPQTFQAFIAEEVAFSFAIELHMTEAQKDARILALCADLGIGKDEARKMLVKPDEKIIDAAYEIVPPALTAEESEDQARRDREAELKRLRRKMTPEELAEHKEKMRAEKSKKLKAEYQRHQQPQDDDTVDAGSQLVVHPDLLDIL